MDTVLFACIHNAGRSQMAAAWFNKMCDRTKARAISAGTQPGERVHPEVVAVLREEGIDLNGVKPQFLAAELAAGNTARDHGMRRCLSECARSQETRLAGSRSQRSADRISSQD